MARERLITAAGGVVWRPAKGRSTGSRGQARVRVLIVHRPGYDDWTFPKGKPETGEDLATAAVREISEETGLRVRLGQPLPEATYRVSAGPKRVSYWCAVPEAETEAGFRPNREVDEVRWVKPGAARKLLTYPHDRIVLAAFREVREVRRHDTQTLIVLRHAKAHKRDHWDGPDLERPLTGDGANRARELTRVLDAYGVRTVVSSPAVRCVETVRPYAAHLDTRPETDPRLSEDTSRRDVAAALEEVLHHSEPVVLCTHRPTLPWVAAVLDVEPTALAPGEGYVVHHRNGRLVAAEPLPQPAGVVAPPKA